MPVDDEIQESEGSLRGQKDGKGDESGSMAYPERPGERDCAYYLKTGMCGYGDDCKFNHPTYNVQDNQHGGQFPERVGEPDCAYFLKTGTCQYGSKCKYNHPPDRRGAAPVLFNTMGLPMREGHESCSHYIRTGSCKFGAGCKFHHPETRLGGPNDPNQPVSGSLTYAPTHISGGPGWPYFSPQTYLPLLLPSSSHNPGWSPISSPSPSPYIGNMSPVFSTNGLTYVDHVYPSTPSSDLPARPGEPECRFFMSTGTCKYGLDCKYHHPKANMVKTDASSFGPFGLPLRPGQPMCSNYMLYGICKYGSGCKYDHPLMVYSYNYMTGMTSASMVDPSLLSYGGMGSYETCPSKSLKNPGWISDQIGNVKLSTDDSTRDHVGSSRSSS